MKRIAILIVWLSLLVVPTAMADSGPASSREFSAQVTALRAEVATVAGGLESAILKDDVRAAESLYALEMKASHLLRESSRATFKRTADKTDAQARTRATLQDVLRLQERLLEHTLVELDRALPGEPHRQMWSRNGYDLYRPLGRAETPVPGQPATPVSQVLRDMQQDFTSNGGSKEQIRYLGPKTLKELPSAQLVEWVQRGSRIRVTAAGAKHPIIALDGPDVEGSPGNGHSVRGAGSMMIHRDGRGAIVAVVVSNSSGNYKPGIGSTAGLVAKLESIGVPAQNILVTRTLPGEPVLVKLLLKSKKSFTKEQIKERVKTLEARVAQQLQPRAAAPARMLSKSSGRYEAGRARTRAKWAPASARHQQRPAAARPTRAVR